MSCWTELLDASRCGPEEMYVLKISTAGSAQAEILLERQGAVVLIGGIVPASSSL